MGIMEFTWLIGQVRIKKGEVYSLKNSNHEKDNFTFNRVGSYRT
jgi:hypothetical protein